MRATPDNAAVDAAAPPVRLRPGQRAERLATRALHRLVPLRAQHRLTVRRYSIGVRCGQVSLTLPGRSLDGVCWSWLWLVSTVKG